MSKPTRGEPRLRRRSRPESRAAIPSSTGAPPEIADLPSDLVALHDLAPVGYLTLSWTGIIRTVNGTAAAMLGRSRAALVGYPFTRLVREGQRRRFLAHLTRLRHGDTEATIDVDIVPLGKAPVPVHMISAARGGSAISTAIVDLTERRRADHELRRERGLLASIMSAADVMLVYLDTQFNFVWVNDAYAKTCGMHPDDMVGKNHFALYPDAENEAIFRRVRDTGEAASFRDKPFEFPDQSERGITHWHWSLVPVKDADGTVVGLVFSLRDTTRFKRAEMGLAASEQRYRILVEQSPDAVLIYREGRITFVNPAAVVLFGAAEGGELLGRSPLEFFQADRRPLIRERIERVLAGERVPLLEERLVPLDGGVRDVEVASTLVEMGEGRGVQVIMRDITWRKAAERDLEVALAGSRRQEVERAALLHAARTVLDKPGFGEAAEVILSSCKAVGGGRAGFVAVCAQDGSRCEVVHADLGVEEQTLASGMVMPMRGLREFVRTSRQTVLENEFSGSRWAAGVPEGHFGLSSVLLAPLIVGPDVLGVLGLANKTGGFSGDDARLASAFAELAAVALLNHRTLEALARSREELESKVKDRTARLAAINVLLEGERRRLFSLLEELPIFVYLREADCTIRFANRYFREHFGEPQGKRCYELVGAGDAPCAGCRAADVLASRQGSSFEWNSPVGKTYQIHNYPFVDTDGSELVLEMGIDVTELRQAIVAEQRARRAADTLREGSLALTRTLELDAVLATLLEHLRALVPCNRARVMMLEGEARLVVRAAVDADVEGPVPPRERAAFDSAENPVIHEVIATGVAAVIADIRAHPEGGS